MKSPLGSSSEWDLNPMITKKTTESEVNWVPTKLDVREIAMLKAPNVSPGPFCSDTIRCALNWVYIFRSSCDQKDLKFKRI